MFDNIVINKEIKRKIYNELYELLKTRVSLNKKYYQNNELQEYVKQYGIIIESWYPFGGRGHTDENFNNETIIKIAKKYNKTSAQIILRWQLQAGYIAIPGSKNPDHIKENISIFDFELDDEDMKEIYNINENRRYENW